MPTSDYAVAGAPAWIEPLFHAIDGRDWRTFGAYLTPDVVFRYGSGPAVAGHAAVLAAADGALKPFAAVRHELAKVWDAPDRVVMEGRVTYALADGRSVTLPFVNVFGMRDGLIAEYLINIDPTPLAALFPKPPAYAGVLGVARAPFLPLAVLLALSGAIAQAGRAVDAGALGWTVLGLVAAHVLVNVLNEINDYRSGIDLQTVRTPFSGGSGALPAGLISVRGAWVVAFVSGIVALAAAVRLVPQGGTPLLAVIGLGAATVLFYSPFWLRLGVGEIVAGLGLGGLPVLGAALVQASGGPVAPAAWWVALAAFAMTANLLLLNTYPDLGPDRAGGRRTLPILIGSRPAALVYAGLVLLEVGALVAGIATGALPVWAAFALLPALAVVPAVRWALAGAPNDMPPLPALGGNVVWNLATHATLVGTLLLAG